MRVSTDSLTEPLDRLEASLPALPSKALSLGRATVRRSNDVACTVVGHLTDSITTVTNATSAAARTATGQARSAADRTASTAGTGARTVAGQARSAADRTASTAATGARTVAGQARAASTDAADTARSTGKAAAGQARAQADRVAGVAEDEVEGLLDDATDAIDPDTPLEDLTKEELYERAQDRDIEGRSTMSKGELVSALRADGA
jgi:ribosomal protein L4